MLWLLSAAVLMSSCACVNMSWEWTRPLTCRLHRTRDYRGPYWGQTALSRLDDVTCTCEGAAETQWTTADRWHSAESGHWGGQLYSPGVGHQLIPIVKQTLSAAGSAAGRWSGGDVRGEGVGSISVVGCSSPTRLALDLEELWDKGKGAYGGGISLPNLRSFNFLDSAPVALNIWGSLPAGNISIFFGNVHGRHGFDVPGYQVGSAVLRGRIRPCSARCSAGSLYQDDINNQMGESTGCAACRPLAILNLAFRDVEHVLVDHLDLVDLVDPYTWGQGAVIVAQQVKEFRVNGGSLEHMQTEHIQAESCWDENTRVSCSKLGYPDSIFHNKDINLILIVVLVGMFFIILLSCIICCRQRKHRRRDIRRRELTTELETMS